ncbi:hypothetical protein Ciccas_001245 [Cichlidogyrus casuarinus]|uniref:Neurotransmitter-gated ion-channel ligand-binding domain-containing protein n=1 Tax=Cichlidogyrus casuarinus TaxID=1844966 RepID=A0ABD2QKN2_9PLAT
MILVFYLFVLTIDLQEEHFVETVTGLTGELTEKRLLKELMLSYQEMGVLGRPVNESNPSVEVKIGISLVQILGINEKSQVLTTNVWITLEWNDTFLKWNKQEWQGIGELRIKSDQIWTPDIVLYNFADERIKQARDVFAVVKNEGKVEWMPPAILKSTCKIDITMFPFDVQICFIKLGSWTYSENLLNISQLDEGLKLNDYTESNEWTILHYTTQRFAKTYSCCADLSYPDFHYFFA